VGGETALIITKLQKRTMTRPAKGPLFCTRRQHWAPREQFSCALLAVCIRGVPIASAPMTEWKWPAKGAQHERLPDLQPQLLITR
jgi:hypothetical protein